MNEIQDLKSEERCFQTRKNLFSWPLEKEKQSTSGLAGGKKYVSPVESVLAKVRTGVT